MGIDGINTLNSTPSIDVSLGSFTQQNSDQRGGRQSFSTALANTAVDSVELSKEAQDAVRKLQSRDREVRAHEQAHIAASGGYAQGGANYTYTKGPDDKMYAIGGSVSLDVSPIPGDPEATEKKARTIRAAALAPADPSAQDQSVAAQASAMAQQAQRDQRAENEAEAEESGAQSGTDAAVNGASSSQGLAQSQGLYGADARLNTNAIHAQASDSASGLATQNAQSTSSATRLAFFRDSSLSIVSSSNSMFYVGHGSAALAPAATSLDKAHAAYRMQQNSAVTQSALAPAGTGIDMLI